MGTGLSSDGGVMAPPDVRDAGELEWATVAGMSPTNPIASRSRTDYGGFDPEFSRGDRIVTTPEGQQGPVSGGLAATPDMPGVALLDDWRDLFNFRGSPMPWLLLFALIFLGFMQFRVDARAGRGGASASARAALG